MDKNKSNKNKYKYLLTSIAIAGILSNASGVTVNATEILSHSDNIPEQLYPISESLSDDIAPELLSITSERQKYYTNELISLDLKILENESLEGISITFTNYEETFTIERNNEDNPFDSSQNGIYSTTVDFMIPKDKPIGRYYISEIELTDSNNSKKLVQGEFPLLYLDFVTSKDTEAPILLDITTDRPVYETGDTVNITMKVLEDSPYKIANLRMSYEGEGFGSSFSYGFNYEETVDGISYFTMKHHIGESDVAGSYGVYEFDIIDSNGNKSTYNPDLSFDVVYKYIDSSDVEPPKVLDFNYEILLYDGGWDRKVPTIEMDYILEESSVIKTRKIRYHNLDTGKKYFQTLYGGMPSDENGKIYENLSPQVPRKLETGNYIVDEIEFRDSSNNFTNYNPEIKFNIVNNEETIFETIPYEVEYVYNSDMENGTTAVKQPGVLGERKIERHKIYFNEELVSSNDYGKTVTKQPRTEIIEIGTKEVTEETRTEEVDFEIEYVENPNLLVGTEEVSQEGFNGTRTIIEKVTTVSGEETDREVISNEITTAPVNKVIQVGTKEVTEETRTEEVDFEIEYVENPNLLVGTEEVSQEGFNGTRTIIEKLTTVGGKETEREVVSEEITTVPVNKVIQVGTKAHEIEDTATVVTEETSTEEVDFEIEYVENPNLLVGIEEVSQEGFNGTRTIIEKVTTVGGEETGREVVSSEITTVPVNKVVQVGTKVEDTATEVTEETRTEEVGFEIEYVNNPDLAVGTEEVSQEGSNGVRTVVEEVTTVGGKETGREIISSEITTAPVNKVVQVGTKALEIEDTATVVTQESRTEEVAFEIEYVKNPDLMIGTEEVSQEGTNGTRTIIEEVTTVGGKETGREVISSDITTAPVNKVVQVGTKVEDAATEITEETRTEEIAFEIEYVKNPDLLVGTEEVSQEGSKGVRTIIEEITIVAGEETGREVISNDITTAPVNKVVQVGTKALEIEDTATIVTEETRTEEIAFEIEYVKNPDLMVGTEEVSQEGENGVRTVVEEVTTVGGEETGREVISSEITTAPVNKVIQIGTGESLEENQGWVKDGNTWYYYDNAGKAQTGWNKIKGTWYYMNNSGTMQTGWTQIGNTWYYMTGSGAMQTGWTKVGSSWYYMTGSGAMQTGWQQIGGKWYYLDNSGAMNSKSGWNKIGNNWYYQTSSGAMDTGWRKIGSNWYYMKDNAIMQTGWTKVGNTWYYMTGSGAMQTGWTRVGSTWYYMTGSGAMQTGWTKVGNTWYYMTGSGAMQTGWTKVGSTWYYMSGSGAMQTGWLKLGRNWYFLNSNGSMQVQNTTINGTWYRFDSSGRMI